MRKPSPASPAAAAAGGIMSSASLMRQQYTVLDFVGEWRTLLGKPAVGFVGMIWGKPGQGKSTAAIRFARYLALQFGRTLYVSSEESNSHTLQDKVARSGGSVAQLDFAGAIPADALLAGYQFLFIDSINSAKVGLDEFKRLHAKFPQLGIVMVFQATKDGNFKGGQEWEHETDFTVAVENGKAATRKNRFGSLSQIVIF